MADNIVDGYGVLNSPTEGAIRISYTDGIAITGNTATDFAENGICFNLYNTYCLCFGNLVSAGISAGTAHAIRVNDRRSEGFIIANRSNGYDLYPSQPPNFNGERLINRFIFPFHSRPDHYTISRGKTSDILIALPQDVAVICI